MLDTSNFPQYILSRPFLKQGETILWTQCQTETLALANPIPLPHLLPGSVRKAESRMVISEVVLLAVWQIVPVIPSALFAQSVFPPDIKEENNGAEDTQPDEPKPQSISKLVLGCLTRQKHVAGKGLAIGLKQ